MSSRIVIGSRGSKLALTQAEWVRTELTRLNPDLEIQIDIVRTTGDAKPDPLSIIGGKGVFTKELEDALLDRRVDLAVHSLKDLPTTISDGLTISAICEREDPRDALVLPNSGSASLTSLASLQSGAVVGTSSPRRLAQLQNARPDLTIKELRGNVDTRLRKLDEGQYDALILAAAGLRRLGLKDRVSFVIPTEQMLPAVGQGALGLQTRDDNVDVNEVVARLNHPNTRLACLAERALLRKLGGGCQLPIAAHAVVSGEELVLDGLVSSRDGQAIVRNQVRGSANDAELIGSELAQRLVSDGALELLERNES
jgi:hydroxymethylbilane synthase